MKVRLMPQPASPRSLAERLLLLAWAGLLCAVLAEFHGARTCSTAAQLGQPGGGSSTVAAAVNPLLEPDSGADDGSAGRVQPGEPTRSLAEGSGSADAPGASNGLTWQQLDELIHQPAGLHGRLKKGGMPADWPKLLAHMTNKNAQLHGVPEFMSQAVFRWFAAAYT